jgi:hypothetical protein
LWWREIRYIRLDLLCHSFNLLLLIWILFLYRLLLAIYSK